MATLIDLRHLDAQERGNPPEPESIPYVPDHALAAAIRAHTDALGGSCLCRSCQQPTWTNRLFHVCPKCGNKRCPKADNHAFVCTGSNEPGQIGVLDSEREGRDIA